jgi:hypothetical protein
MKKAVERIYFHDFKKTEDVSSRSNTLDISPSTGVVVEGCLMKWSHYYDYHL